MFSGLNIKLAAIIGIPILIIVVWKYIDLKLTISDLEDENNNFKAEVVVLKTDLNTERANVDILKNTIDELNNDIKKWSVKYQNINEKFSNIVKKNNTELFTGAAAELFKNKNWKDATCEEGLLLNKQISELKYEDL